MDGPTAHQGDAQRLQKVLAAAGVGSRRQCEELILDGRVEIDRRVVTELGTRVDLEAASIRVDGVSLKLPRRFYFAVNKPKGVVSTARDPWRRTRVIDLIASKERLFTIGRLDKESSGLILVTNDGELANRLTHPRYQVAKTYHVNVAGLPSLDVLRQLRRGCFLADGPVRPESVVVKKRLKQSTLLEIVLSEGRNREIRRMLARVKHKVLRLHRVAIGPIRLGVLPIGANRELTRDEVRRLKGLESGAGQTKSGRRAKPPRGKQKPTRGADRSRGTVIGGAPPRKHEKSGSRQKTARHAPGKSPAIKKTGRRRPTRSAKVRYGSAGA